MNQKSFGYEKSMDIVMLLTNMRIHESVPTNRGLGEPFRILGRLIFNPIPAIATHSNVFPDCAKNAGIKSVNNVESNIVMAKPVTYQGGPFVFDVFS